jgi:hypothetical protein
MKSFSSVAVNSYPEPGGGKSPSFRQEGISPARFQNKNSHRATIYVTLMSACLLMFVFFSCSGDFALQDRDRYSPKSKEPQSVKTSADTGGVTENRKSADNLSALSFNEEKKDETGEALRSETDSTKTKTETAKPPAKPENDRERQHVYFGYMTLVVASVKDARDGIAKLATDSKGYVETSRENMVVIRIPKDKFDEVFSALTGLGEVKKKSIETYDVTEYFRDMTTRLAVAERTRARLYGLLERATEVEERLKILKEIKRLSEEIENTRLRLESLARLIDFSSITVELEQRLAEVSAGDKQSIPFPWIKSLDPFYPSIPALDYGTNLRLSDDFAVFDDKKYFFAESTDGIRVRVGTVANKPSGDTAFWQKAVLFHLSPYYKDASEYNLGDTVKGVLFKSRDAKPFYYIVGVAAERGVIFVVEVFYPNEAAFKDKGERVRESVRRMKIT